MTRNRMRGSLCVWVVIAVVCGCGVTSGQTAGRAIKADSAAVAQWKERLSAIQKSLEASNENCVGAPAAGIVDAFGVNADELSVALVYSCGGGAYTDYIVAMRMDHGEPALAKFRDAKGKIVEKGFASGASAMNTVDVKLAAEKKAIYDLFAQNDSSGKLAKCGAQAYVWNAMSKTFDLDLRLSKSASEEYCLNLRANN